MDSSPAWVRRRISTGGSDCCQTVVPTDKPLCILLISLPKKTREGSPSRSSNVATLRRFFVSYKCSDGSGNPTRDSEIAAEVYRHLTVRGLSVFFSNVTLEKVGESAFSQAIDAALDAAQTLVAIGTTTAHLQSGWVQYEWQTFHNDLLSHRKPSGEILAYVENLPAASLPRALRSRQVIHHDGDKSIATLYDFIASSIGIKLKKSDIRSADWSTPWRDRYSHPIEAASGPRVQPFDKTLVPSLLPGSGREQEFDIDGKLTQIKQDTTLSRDDRAILQAMWKVAAADQQREKIMDRLISLDREDRRDDGKLREAMFLALENLNEARERAMADIRRLSLDSGEIKKLFE